MPDSSNKGANKSRGAGFLSRVASTIVLWLLIAVAGYFNRPELFSLLIITTGSLALFEFFGLLGLKGIRSFRYVGFGTLVIGVLYLSSIAYSLSGHWTEGIVYIDSGGIAAVIMLSTVFLLFHHIDGGLTKDVFFGSIFGFVYVSVLISFLLRILYLGSNEIHASVEIRGHYYLLFLLVVTKFSDMGAYLIGTMIGKNKMIPHISPGKTWEGFLFGCLTFAVGGGCLVFALFGDKMPLLGWPEVVILGFVLALFAAVGDLAESVLKRSLKTKDSGNVIPGIGGVLDIVDSLLFTAPVLYLYLTLLS